MPTSYKTINLISWLMLITFIIINLVFIAIYAVDIPYWDEWEIVWDLPNLSLDRLFALHNEHLIVTTKLYAYLLYVINGLNFKYMTITNYFFFIGMALSLYLIIKNYTKVNLSRHNGVDCVKEFYAGNKNSLCITIYPKPLDKHLKKASELELSFTK